jgi:hypothetical protein
MSQRQGTRAWLIIAVLVILGLTAGLGLGLLFGWVVMPVKYVDTTFADLQVEYKEEYMVMVASAYSCDGDLAKAQARLEALDAPNTNQWLADLIDRYILEGHDEDTIRALVNLAHAQGVGSPNMAAYLATATPLPTSTPVPTLTPLPTDVPTMTPVPPTEVPATQPPTETPVAPTNTSEPNPTDTPQPVPTDTSVPPTDTPVPPTDTSVPPTNTPAPPTNTPKPQPTNTPKPPPTNTPKPPAPAAKWTVVEQRLVGPGQDGQGCDYGNLQIRVTVVDAGGNQISGVWVYDKYSQQYQLTGNVGSPEWGPGETKFEYGIGGGGSLCIADSQGGGCVSGYTRDMPCYFLPPFDDLWTAGYCQCEKPDITRDECQQLLNEGRFMGPGAGHFSWRVVFRRSS